MLKISFRGCLSLSPAILVQFTLKVCVAARNREKFTKTFYFKGSGSSMLIALKSSSPVLAVPICNHFHARRANSSYKNLLWGTPLMHSFTQRLKILSQKNLSA